MLDEAWRTALGILFGQTLLQESANLSPQRAMLDAQLSLRIPESLFALLDCLATDSRREARLGEFRWLPVDQILSMWTLHAQLAADAEEVEKDVAGDSDNRIRRVTHHVQRLPVAEFNGDIWLYLDYTPTTLGVPGQVIQVDPEGLSWIWLAPSFDQLLVNLAEGRHLDPDAGTPERRNAGTQERRNAGTQERRNAGTQERRTKDSKLRHFASRPRPPRCSDGRRRPRLIGI